MARSPADSFTAYLEEKQRLEKQAAAAPAATGGATPLSILAVLAATPDRKLALADLQAGSGMSFADFAPAMSKLSELGYVTLSGAPGHEVAELTKLGVDVAGLLG